MGPDRLLRAGRQWVALTVVGASLCACTIVQVDGPAKTTRLYPGVLQIAPADDAEMVAYQARGIGLVSGHNGVTLGISSETVVAMRPGDQCRIILFEPDPEAVSALAALLEPVVTEDELCSVGG